MEGLLGVELLFVHLLTCHTRHTCGLHVRPLDLAIVFDEMGLIPQAYGNKVGSRETDSSWLGIKVNDWFTDRHSPGVQRTQSTCASLSCLRSVFLDGAP